MHADGEAASHIDILTMRSAAHERDLISGVVVHTSMASRPIKGTFAHTYSIVAVDRQAGIMGAAVQSHWFSVGSVVPWARPGAGVVATQSFTDPAYGPRGLDLMADGVLPSEALASLVAEDDGRDVRQVAMVDIKGNAAAHTGAGCIAEAGHITGEGFSVQANMMLHPTVPAAMAAAFRETEGRLAERMLAALAAAEAEGGDIRGRQSACLLVVRMASTGRPWEDRLTDLRIEDSADPLVELARLLKVQRAYEHMDAGDVALARGDHARALVEYSSAESLYPENEEIVYWTAVGLANSGRVDESLPRFRQVFERNANWRELTSRLFDKGQITVDGEDLKRILSV